VSINAVYKNTEYLYEDLSLVVIDFIESKVMPYMDLYGIAQHCELIYICDGVGACVIDDKSYFLKKGHFMYIPKNCYKQICVDKGHSLDLYTIIFEYNFHNSMFRQLPLSHVFNTSSKMILNNYYSELYNIWTEKKGAFQLEARAIVMKIIYELIFPKDVIYYEDKEVEESSRINKIVEYIIRHHQENIQIEDIACLFNLNPAYLGSYFKKHTGYTIRQCINYVRIHNAKKLLMTGKYTVGQVAEQCGYKNVYYFSKIFKHIEGVPPTQFIF
jgi:AraC-like DNA-binding protein